MLVSPSFYFCLFVVVQIATAQRRYGVCSQVFQMYQYCISEQSATVDTGPTSVNSTEMSEYINKKFEEMEAIIDAKFKAYERLLNESVPRHDDEEETAEAVIPSYPTDCGNVRQEDAKIWNGTGGIFDIYPASIPEGVEVYCEIPENGRGWAVFQRRLDGSVDFDRDWTDYVNGFGDKDKEMWLGLENIHQLTKDGEYELRVDLSDWEGNTAYAHYGNFTVGAGSDNYRLTVGEYRGDAGDSLAYQSGHQFSTRDADHDKFSGSCGGGRRGGWWYNDCTYSRLNGLYYNLGISGLSRNAIIWYHWKSSFDYSMKTTEMKFRKKSTSK